ncbi:MAG TPA: bifunctional serine/threonine-protein kinase/formylglycine-generating enzyme family protein [Kofleriaceae bacterium]
MAEIHINVGLVALARGFITLESFAKTMGSLAQGSISMSVRDLWIGPDRLSETQFAAVLDQIGPVTGRDTMLYSLESVAQPVNHGSGPGHGIPALISKAEPTVRAKAAVPPPVPPAKKLANAAQGTGSEPTSPSFIPPLSPKADTHTRAKKPTTIPPSLPAADMVGSRYKRLFPLGSGGLGEVVACEDLVLGRTVALKAGHMQGGVDSYSTKVILAREARIISHLEHPNIIPIYDAGTDPQRGPFYVMRQVTEQSFDSLLRKRRSGEGDAREYSLNRLLRYFLQVCNAVDYAHYRGVIHCDIKPANILLGDYGEVLLVDWGLAQSRVHPLGVRGGTLGYMAPEQMDPHCDRFDERTDVFALGALLYEILCGKAAFPEVKNSDVTTVGVDPLALYQTPPLPSKVAKHEEVSPELEDFCMRAIAIDRQLRLPSARFLADAIDEFIEGSKEKARKKLEADRNADNGDELAERYFEFAESRPEKVTVFRALRADVVPWAVPDDKQDLWDAEDIIRVTDALQVRTLQSAISAYESALENVGNHTRAKKGLAALYYNELKLARRRGDGLGEVAYEQLLREVDDGDLAHELSRDGQLLLTIPENASRVTLAKLAERDRRLVDQSVEVITTRPDLSRALSAGRYVVSATFAEDQTVSWPVKIEPGAISAVRIHLAANDLRSHEVLVPAGPTRLGGDPLSTDTEETLIVDVPAFVIQRHPVTLAKWFEFLDELRETDPHAVGAHIPRTNIGAPTWQYSKSKGSWIADKSVAAIVLPPTEEANPNFDPMTLPVFGVSAVSAEVFAKWLSKKDGFTWRLPNEIEWEKAGRGVDGRVFPWGDHFDATFCKMRDSRGGLPHAEPVGSYLWDVSPYGVCDMAGGSADWCTPDHRRTAPREPREVVSRGGAWCDWSIDCRLASRRRYYATEHSARVGVRLVRDV